MAAPAYKVTGTFKKRVQHNCPGCQVELENDLSEAGGEDRCPQCGHAFKVPGERELAEEADKRNAAAAVKARAKEEAERRAKEEERAATADYDRRAAVELAAHAAKEQERKTRAEAAKALYGGSARKAPTGGIQVVPAYSGLGTIGGVFEVLGFLSLVLGTLIGGFIILAALGTDHPALTILPGIVVFLTGLIYGTIMLAIGNGIKALRDIAINSFHTSNTLYRLHEQGAAAKA